MLGRSISKTRRAEKQLAYIHYSCIACVPSLIDFLAIIFYFNFQASEICDDDLEELWVVVLYCRRVVLYI